MHRDGPALGRAERCTAIGRMIDMARTCDPSDVNPGGDGVTIDRGRAGIWIKGDAAVAAAGDYLIGKIFSSIKAFVDVPVGRRNKQMIGIVRIDRNARSGA